MQKYMKLHKIEITNFKSYSGTTVIGPFDNFTCIIGPNGSGKSNVVDAITFAMNVSLKHLRVSRPNELVNLHNNDNNNECSVSLHVTKEHNNDLIANTAIFTRRFDINKQSYAYLINNKQTSSTNYTKELEKLNIFSKIRNFIIYQGMLLKDNLNLFDAIEKISGSVNYKSEYDTLKEQYLKLNKELLIKQERKKDILNDLNELNAAKEKQVVFVKNMQKLEKVKKKIYLLEIKLKEKSIGEFGIKLAELEKERTAVEKDANYKKVTKKINALKKKIAEQTKELFEVEAEMKCIQSGNTTDSSNMSEIQKVRSKIEKLEGEVSKLTKGIDFTDMDKEEFEKELNAAKEEYSEQIVDFEKEESKLLLENFEMVSKKEECLMEIKKYTEKKQKLQKENEKIYRENENKKKMLGKLNNELTVLTNKATPEALNQLKQLDLELTTKEEELNGITKDILLHKATHAQSKHEIFVANVIENLKSINPKVCGRVGSLILPSNSTFNSAIGNLLVKHNNSVIVEDTDAAIQCIEYLKQTKSCKLTFLSMDRIYGDENNNIISNDEIFLNPMNCVNYDGKYVNVVSHLFRNKAILKESAQNVNVMDTNYSAIVTMDGVLYQKNGLVTIGGTFNNNDSQSDFNVIEALSLKRSKMLNEIKLLKNKKEAYAGLNILLDKIKDIEETIANTKFEELHEVEKLMSNVDIKQLEMQLNECTKDLTNYEYSKQFINENKRIKEREIVLPVLKKINITSIDEYNRRMKDSERKEEIDGELLELKEKLSELEMLEEHNENDTNKLNTLNTLSELNKKYFSKQNEHEQTKQQYRSKQATYKEYAHKMDMLSNKITNTLMSKTKNEEEMHEFINYCKMECDLTNLTSGENNSEIFEDEEYLKLTTVSNINLMNNLNALNKEKNTLTNSLTNNATLNIKDDSLEGKYLKFNRDYEFAKDNAQKAKKHFNEIAAERKKLLMKYFEELQKKINEIYYELSYSDENVVENVENNTNYASVVTEGDIFNTNSIKYYVIPPHKNYCEFGELSGGERSIAALAFLFALTKTPPFYVLDEVDAALDGENSKRLINFIKKKKESKQYVVISLKDTFYKEADGLVGVYKDREENKSKILTYRIK